MKRLLVLALLLAAALVEFLLVGRPALAAERAAHADLLAREIGLRQLAARLPPDGAEPFGALFAERERLGRLAEQRLALVRGATGAAAAPRPSFEDLLAARSDRALSVDSRLGAAVRAQARASLRAAEALALLLEALADCGGLEALELSEGGAVAPVAGIPELEQLQASVVLTSSLTDVLAVLERLAPSPAGGLPFAGVRSASLRRVEPERWGGGMHLLDTPPARLALSVAIYFPRPPERGR